MIMKFKRAIVWFRNDLRVHDNENLVRAIQSADEILPVYCFDPRMFEKTKLDFEKTGVFRAKFIRDSVSALRHKLRHLGADLIVVQGKPEEELIRLAENHRVDAIFFSQEVTKEERVLKNQLRVLRGQKA